MRGATPMRLGVPGELHRPCRTACVLPSRYAFRPTPRACVEAREVRREVRDAVNNNADVGHSPPYCGIPPVDPLATFDGFDLEVDVPRVTGRWARPNRILRGPTDPLVHGLNTPAWAIRRSQPARYSRSASCSGRSHSYVNVFVRLPPFSVERPATGNPPSRWAAPRAGAPRRAASAVPTVPPLFAGRRSRDQCRHSAVSDACEQAGKRKGADLDACAPRDQPVPRPRPRGAVQSRARIEPLESRH